MARATTFEQSATEDFMGTKRALYLGVAAIALVLTAPPSSTRAQGCKYDLRRGCRSRGHHGVRRHGQPRC